MKPFEVLLDQQTIARRIREIGQQISSDYAGKSLVLLGVMKGAVVFLADLMRVINLPVEIELVSASSYRAGKKPSENLFVEGIDKLRLANRDVLIVEGIVDSGRTAIAIEEAVRQQEPGSIEIVTLVDKPGSHRSALSIKYKGFTVGNEFVIGFGLDNTQKYRNLPYIGRMVDTE